MSYLLDFGKRGGKNRRMNNITLKWHYGSIGSREVRLEVEALQYNSTDALPASFEFLTDSTLFMLFCM